MNKFFNLSKNKQDSIIDAALKAFGMNGYKKASASDIASTAGISKAMVFHYFGSKKALYLFLIKYCSKMLESEFNEKLASEVSDFFDRLKMISGAKISLMKRHPAILSFLTSVYFETDEDVKAEIQAIWSRDNSLENRSGFTDIDTSKFKDNTDITIVMKMISWIGDGYASRLCHHPEIDFDVLAQEIDSCFDLLKNNLYKEEFL